MRAAPTARPLQTAELVEYVPGMRRYTTSLIQIFASTVLTVGACASPDVQTTSATAEDHRPATFSEATELRLMLAGPTMPVVRGDSVSVDVTLENGAEVYKTVFPVFTGEDQRPSGFPVAALSFEVVKDGKTVERASSRLTHYAKFQVSPHSFLSLPHGSALRHRITLTQEPFGYAIDETGRYRVRASLTLHGRAWVENTMEYLGIEDHELLFDLRTVFDGTLRSNDVEIEVAAGP